MEDVPDGLGIVFGDAEKTKKMLEKFSKRCVLVSQVRSAVEFAQGDKAAALATQKEFIDSAKRMKRTAKTFAAESDTGKAAMKKIVHKTAVLVGGSGGYAAAGTAGSVAGGIAAGIIADGVITGISSAVHKQYKPYGPLLEALKNHRELETWHKSIASALQDGSVGEAAAEVVSKASALKSDVCSRGHVKDLVQVFEKMADEPLGMQANTVQANPSQAVLDEPVNPFATIMSLMKLVQELEATAGLSQDVKIFIREVKEAYRREKIVAKPVQASLCMKELVRQINLEESSLQGE